MKALFCHDHYYYTDGDLTLSKGQYHHSIWEFYLQFFDHLTVTGRDGGNADKHEKGINQSSYNNVSFSLYPNSNSLKGLLSGREEIHQSIANLIKDHDVIILRGTSELGAIAFAEAKKQGKMIVMEVVSCAFDELWYHGSMKAKIYSLYRFLKQRQLAKKSDAVIYVSKEFLQRRYPSTAPLIARASDVFLPQNSYFKKDIIQKDVYKIGLIGTLKNKLKGIYTVIDAVTFLKSRGVDNFEIHVLGPGDPDPIQRLIDERNIADNLMLDGLRQSGEEVWQWLRGMDAYIQPSFQEGVPRATLEAMAQGLPVISSEAGGLPELIDTQWIIQRGNAHALAEKIEHMINDIAAMKSQGEKNFKTAQDYEISKMNTVRHDFWNNVKHIAGEKR